MSLIILSLGGRREGKKDRCGTVISLRQQERRGVKLQPRPRRCYCLFLLSFLDFKFTISTFFYTERLIPSSTKIYISQRAFASQQRRKRRRDSSTDRSITERIKRAPIIKNTRYALIIARPNRPMSKFRGKRKVFSRDAHIHIHTFLRII